MAHSSIQTTGTGSGHCQDPILTFSRFPALPSIVTLHFWASVSSPKHKEAVLGGYVSPALSELLPIKEAEEGNKSGSHSVPHHPQLLQCLCSTLEVLRGWSIKNASLTVQKDVSFKATLRKGDATAKGNELLWIASWREDVNGKTGEFQSLELS